MDWVLWNGSWLVIAVILWLFMKKAVKNDNDGEGLARVSKAGFIVAILAAMTLSALIAWAIR